VVLGWIWWAEPTPDIFLKMVTFQLILLAYHLLNRDESLPYVMHGCRAIANDELQVAHEAVYNLKCLGSSDASLIESEAVESM